MARHELAFCLEIGCLLHFLCIGTIRVAAENYRAFTLVVPRPERNG